MKVELTKLPKIYLLLTFFVGVIFLFEGCRKENFVTDSSATVAFSTDSILFDTVFTTVGSTTQLLKVYNNNSDRIRISSIELEGGNNSPYRLNVDGVPGNYHENVEIAGNDSMFIFVEVTLDPNDSSLPFVVEDYIHFNTNGNNQEVVLTAWGQDAYFHVNQDLTSLQPLEPDAIWSNDKPHVIYGIAVVDSAQTLTITEGTEVYIHNNSGLWVRKGTLIVEGQLGNEVVFQGDRLEPFYDDQPGQWGINVFGFNFGGIWLTESLDSRINYADIKNGTIGIQVDSVSQAGIPALTLTNTKIQTMSAIGLYANSGADIEGFNNLIANCGQSCGAFLYGGSYRLDFTTFANYWTLGTRQASAFVMTNWYEFQGSNIIRPITNTLFRNCIMYGNNASLSDFNEFALDILEDESQEYAFSHCLVDNNEIDLDGPRYSNMRIVINNEQIFLDPFNADFHPRSDNIPIVNSAVGTEVSFDLDGTSRFIFGQPDMGCYEFVP